MAITFRTIRYPEEKRIDVIIEEREKLNVNTMIKEAKTEKDQDQLSFWTDLKKRGYKFAFNPSNYLGTKIRFTFRTCDILNIVNWKFAVNEGSITSFEQMECAAKIIKRIKNTNIEIEQSIDLISALDDLKIKKVFCHEDQNGTYVFLPE